MTGDPATARALGAGEVGPLSDLGACPARFIAATPLEARNVTVAGADVVDHGAGLPEPWPARCVALVAALGLEWAALALAADGTLLDLDPAPDLAALPDELATRTAAALARHLQGRAGR